MAITLKLVVFVGLIVAVTCSAVLEAPAVRDDNYESLNGGTGISPRQSLDDIVGITFSGRADARVICWCSGWSCPSHPKCTCNANCNPPNCRCHY